MHMYIYIYIETYCKYISVYTYYICMYIRTFTFYMHKYVCINTYVCFTLQAIAQDNMNDVISNIAALIAPEVAALRRCSVRAGLDRNDPRGPMHLNIGYLGFPC